MSMQWQQQQWGQWSQFPQSYEVRTVMSPDEAKFAQLNNNTPLIMLDQNNKRIYLKDIGNNGLLVLKAYAEIELPDEQQATNNKILALETTLQQIQQVQQKIIQELGIKNE